jgi:pimeloyl-ACP methyl ester carboxylesterase
MTAVTTDAVSTVKANGIDIAYETFGDPSDPPLLLVMGLGAQMLAWEEGLCALLVARGHYVIRFDNRDIGLSTWIDAPGLDIGNAVFAAIGGDTSQAPYLLTDMAADAIGLLDALGIESAHIVGASMGGMIAQTMAIEHPSRVRTLTSIMSTTGEQTVGQPDPALLGPLLTPRPADPAAAIEAGIEMARLIAYEPYFDEPRTRERVKAMAQRGDNAEGVGRQLLAIISSGSRAEGLARLDLPALVIHGRADRLVAFDGGARTAELIAGAEFLPIDDMAHDLPMVHWPAYADAIGQLTGRAR